MRPETIPTQISLWPKRRYPEPVKDNGRTLPGAGQVTAEIPAAEREFLEGLKTGSLVDVKWTTAWAPPTKEHPDGHQTRVTTYRCSGVEITKHTKASLFIGPMRFSRTTSRPVSETANKSMRICSPKYFFFEGERRYREVVTVGHESLPYGMKEKK